MKTREGKGDMSRTCQNCGRANSENFLNFFFDQTKPESRSRPDSGNGPILRIGSLINVFVHFAQVEYKNGHHVEYSIDQK